MRKREPKNGIKNTIGYPVKFKSRADRTPMNIQCAGVRTKKNCQRGGADFETTARLYRTRDKVVEWFDKTNKDERKHLEELLERARKNMTEHELRLIRMRATKVS